MIGDPFEVLLDLRLRGITAAPLGVLRERKGVEVTWNIARAARIGVVSPRSANRTRTLEDDERLKSVLQRHDSCTETTETAPDDGELNDVTLILGHVNLTGATTSRLALLAIPNKGQQRERESKNAKGLVAPWADPR